jgi:glycerol kinase
MVKSVVRMIERVLSWIECDQMCILLFRVDGGVSQNGFVMQLLADLCGHRLTCSKDYDVTVLGTAYLVGLQTS